MLSHHDAIPDETTAACPVVHPFGQLQFELPGIEPITTEEQAAAWIAQQEGSDLPAVLQVRLLLSDGLNRGERAKRWAWGALCKRPTRGSGIPRVATAADRHLKSLGDGLDLGDG